MMGDSDNAVVEAASISDPFIIGNEATQIDSHLSSKSKTCTVIPPLGAERSEEKKAAVADSNSKRAKGAERSREEIDTVADSNSKRAKSGGHGGPRDGSGPKTKEVVAYTIRKGRPRSDRVH